MKTLFAVACTASALVLSNPSASAQELDVPVLEVPELQTPSLGADGIDVPELPELEVPQLQVPALPSLAAPQVPSAALPSLPPISVPSLAGGSLPSLEVPELQMPSLQMPELPALQMPELPAPVMPTLPSAGTGTSARSAGAGGTAAILPVIPPDVLLGMLESQTPEIELTAPQEANTSASRVPLTTFALAGGGVGLALFVGSLRRRREQQELEELPA